MTYATTDSSTRHSRRAPSVLDTPPSWILAQDADGLEEYEIGEQREELEQQQRRLESDRYRMEYGIDGEQQDYERLRLDRKMRESREAYDLFEQQHPSGN